MVALSKSAKGFLLGIIIVIAGLWYSMDKTSGVIILTAAATSILLTAVVNRFIRGTANEIFISGFIITLVETYHFFIQPNLLFLPDLPGQFQLFIGFLILVRVSILALEIIDTPLRKPVRRFLQG